MNFIRTNLSSTRNARLKRLPYLYGLNTGIPLSSMTGNHLAFQAKPAFYAELHSEFFLVDIREKNTNALLKMKLNENPTTNIKPFRNRGKEFFVLKELLHQKMGGKPHFSATPAEIKEFIETGNLPRGFEAEHGYSVGTHPELASTADNIHPTPGRKYSAEIPDIKKYHDIEALKNYEAKHGPVQPDSEGKVPYNEHLYSPDGHNGNYQNPSSRELHDINGDVRKQYNKKQYVDGLVFGAGSAAVIGASIGFITGFINGVTMEIAIACAKEGISPNTLKKLMFSSLKAGVENGKQMLLPGAVIGSVTFAVVWLAQQGLRVGINKSNTFASIKLIKLLAVKNGQTFNFNSNLIGSIIGMFITVGMAVYQYKEMRSIGYGRKESFIVAGKGAIFGMALIALGYCLAKSTKSDLIAFLITFAVGIILSSAAIPIKVIMNKNSLKKIQQCMEQTLYFQVVGTAA